MALASNANEPSFRSEAAWKARLNATEQRNAAARRARTETSFLRAYVEAAEICFYIENRGTFALV